MRSERTGNRATRFFTAEVVDRPIADNKHFVCLATLGSIVPGWTLIAPKRPTANLSCLYPSEQHELESLVSAVTRVSVERFGPVVLFEHGAMMPGSATGCGVDQAHLHIVPISIGLFENAVRDAYAWLPSSAQLPHELDAPNAEYLWYSAGGMAKVAFPKIPISQFFRRAIARAAGCPDQWDYREHPFFDNIGATHAAFMGAFYKPEKRAG